MARKLKREVFEDEASGEEIADDPPSEIDPYEVLGLDKKATADQIKSAYRKQALKHHPDKASVEDKETSHKRFQEIAFAYAILSDERRRKRYDTTGNTAESLDLEEDDFSWTDFFREQTAAMVDGKTIEKIKQEYQHSEEEKEDLLAAYEDHEGDMDAIYEEIMCSSVLDDDKRFRAIIDAAIKAGEVESYPKYTKESKAVRRKRAENAKKEESEAMAMAEELGVKDKLFGKGKNGKTGKKADGEAGLQALIQQRQKGRAETFMDQLEAKYGGGKQGPKRKVMDEPSEELFEKNAKNAKKSRA